MSVSCILLPIICQCCVYFNRVICQRGVHFDRVICHCGVYFIRVICQRGVDLPVKGTRFLD